MRDKEVLRWVMLRRGWIAPTCGHRKAERKGNFCDGPQGAYRMGLVGQGSWELPHGPEGLFDMPLLS